MTNTNRPLTRLRRQFEARDAGLLARPPGTGSADMSELVRGARRLERFLLLCALESMSAQAGLDPLREQALAERALAENLNGCVRPLCAIARELGYEDACDGAAATVIAPFADEEDRGLPFDLSLATIRSQAERIARTVLRLAPEIACAQTSAHYGEEIAAFATARLAVWSSAEDIAATSAFLAQSDVFQPVFAFELVLTGDQDLFDATLAHRLGRDVDAVRAAWTSGEGARAVVADAFGLHNAAHAAAFRSLRRLAAREWQLEREDDFDRRLAIVESFVDGRVERLQRSA